MMRRVFVIVILLIAFLIGVIVSFFSADEKERLKQEVSALKRAVASREETVLNLHDELASISGELERVKQEDQRKINQTLMDEINAIHKTYDQTVSSYEEIIRIRELTQKTQKLDEQFANIISLLGKRDYKTAQEKLSLLAADIQKLKDSLRPTSPPVPSVKHSNTPPGSGYSRQSVSTLGTNFVVDLVAGDLGSTRVIVDTASDRDCKDNCPVLSLAEYVSRNGAYAGINGSYFCPASYPSCAGKTNSFDTLLMNKHKVYFNSENNVYSVVPAVIFLGSSVRFVQKSLEWGRDTGIDSMIANQGLLVFGGNVVYGDDGDPKKGSKGSRSFVANKGNTVYIGVTHNATVAENAHVMKALGMDNALNLDSGGSTALWYGGYKVGPGRNIPNAILFVRR
ncbi:MAG: phosphodiester glycosidase family protein [Patescibacteria group bacterium]|nr:phosphodiester glycosidase family protein [Patescibacteria group bacterium]